MGSSSARPKAGEPELRFYFDRLELSAPLCPNSIAEIGGEAAASQHPDSMPQSSDATGSYDIVPGADGPPTGRRRCASSAVKKGARDQ